MPVVVVAAFVGTTFESMVGAALEKRQLLDNEALNFLNTLVGALVAAAFAAWVALRISMSKLSLYSQLARPFTLLPPLLRHRLGRDLRLRLGAQPGPRPRASRWRWC